MSITTNGSPQMVIPRDFNLPQGVEEIQGKEGGIYLQFNTCMTTLYKQTCGELSRFFLFLRKGILIGNQCPACQQVMVPPVTWHCPECNFTEMIEIPLLHQGILAATAPITIFPRQSMIGQAPFCRGYLDVAQNAPVASFLPIRLRTTTGLPRPGIFLKDTVIKIVFEDQRQGTILDIFGVPMSEIPVDLQDKEPLLASELNFEKPQPPKVTTDPSMSKLLQQVISGIQQLAEKIIRSPRAKKNLHDLYEVIEVQTPGGFIEIMIGDANLSAREIQDPTKRGVFISTLDPKIFLHWLDDGSLTDAAIEGTLWLPNLKAFGILPVLDRLPRSVRRDLDLTNKDS